MEHKKAIVVMGLKSPQYISLEEWWGAEIKGEGRLWRGVSLSDLFTRIAAFLDGGPKTPFTLMAALRVPNMQT